MLERMKKKINNEKGFTLVELLAVIAILGIILAIAVPSVGEVISNSEEKAHEANVELLENAARLAYLSEEDPKESYTLEELVTSGYLEKVPEAVGEHTYPDGSSVSVTEDEATYNNV